MRLPVPYLIYIGREPVEYNISKHTHDEIAASQIKWWRWLGEPSPDGGVVSTYAGAGYYKYWMYRPTDASIMRISGRPFNLPGREKMIQAFYEHVEPIDSAPTTVDGVSPVAISVLQPSTHDLTIDWYLDDLVVASAHNATRFMFPAGSHAELKVRVVDETPFVRDPAWISELLTQEITWTISS